MASPSYSNQDCLREVRAPPPPGDVAGRIAMVMDFQPATTGEVDLLRETVKMMLTTGLYLPSDKSRSRRSDIPPKAEVVGAGYIAGGKTVRVAAGGKLADLRWMLLGGAEWPQSKIGVMGIVYYCDRGDPAEDVLVQFCGLAGAVHSTGRTWAFGGSCLLVPMAGA